MYLVGSNGGRAGNGTARMLMCRGGYLCNVRFNGGGLGAWRELTVRARAACSAPAKRRNPRAPSAATLAAGGTGHRQGAAPALRALQCRYRIVSGFRGSVGLAARTFGERSQSAAQLLMVWHPVSGP